MIGFRNLTKTNIFNTKLEFIKNGSDIVYMMVKNNEPFKICSINQGDTILYYDFADKIEFIDPHNKFYTAFIDRMYVTLNDNDKKIVDTWFRFKK